MKDEPKNLQRSPESSGSEKPVRQKPLPSYTDPEAREAVNIQAMTSGHPPQATAAVARAPSGRSREKLKQVVHGLLHGQPVPGGPTATRVEGESRGTDFAEFVTTGQPAAASNVAPPEVETVVVHDPPLPKFEDATDAVAGVDEAHGMGPVQVPSVAPAGPSRGDAVAPVRPRSFRLAFGVLAGIVLGALLYHVLTRSHAPSASAPSPLDVPSATGATDVTSAPSSPSAAVQLAPVAAAPSRVERLDASVAPSAKPIASTPSHGRPPTPQGAGRPPRSEPTTRIPEADFLKP